MNDTSIEHHPLNIAMVIDVYDNSQNGAAISTKRFVELLRNEHHVLVITTGDPAPGQVVFPQFYIPVVKKVMKQMNAPLAIPSNKVLNRAIEGMDIVHVQFPFYLGMQSVKIARRHRISVVSTFHIQAEHLAMNAGIRSEKFIRLCYNFWLKNIYNASDVVICPSQFAEDELKRYGLTSKSVIISNGILPIYQPGDFKRKDEFKDKFIILSVGRFAPEKRHDMIISAIQDSKHKDEIQLILIGEGPMKRKLQKIGIKLPNPPIFLSLPSEELVYYYNIADLYVHASVVEVECMTVLESIGCGLPTLISDSQKSATKQFALDNRFLYESGNGLNLINKIDYWIEHQQELRNARIHYYEYSRNYRIEKSYEKLINLYFSLLPS